MPNFPAIVWAKHQMNVLQGYVAFVAHTQYPKRNYGLLIIAW